MLGDSCISGWKENICGNEDISISGKEKSVYVNKHAIISGKQEDIFGLDAGTLGKYRVNSKIIKAST